MNGNKAIDEWFGCFSLVWSFHIRVNIRVMEICII